MKKIILFFAVLVILSSFGTAYTGSIAISPAIPGGPGHTTVSNFKIDTNVKNPITIETNSYYVEKVVITTSEGISGPLLIKEQPTGSSVAFSFTVPNKVQNALVSADIYFWGPDSETLTITHIHKDEAPNLLTATRVSPEQIDEDGRVLWMITTNSFSDFYSEPIKRDFPMFYVIALVMLTLINLIVLRE